MRAIWVAASLAVVMLAGCAEQLPEPVQETEVDAGPVDDGPAENVTVDAFNGTLTALVENTTIASGAPFNVTLDLAANIDVGNVSWMVTFVNQTDDAVPAHDVVNITVDSVSFEGVGFPAVLEVNLTYIGNVTMTATAYPGNATIGSEPVLLELISAAPADPCAGAPVQEPIEKSGTLAPGALGMGFYTSNAFELLPCQSKITIDVHTTTADVIIRLVFPDGSYVDYDSAFVGGETWTYDHGGYMEPGSYSADLYAYATVVDFYDMTLTFE